MGKKKAPKKKVEIVFDPLKRREFLTGFQKRKNARRKKAKEQMMQNIKEERKRIRQEVKDGIKHLKKTFEPLREITEQDKANDDEYEDDEVKVQIVELSTNDLAQQSNLIGVNQVNEDSDSNESVVDFDEVNCVPGMDLNSKLKSVTVKDENELVDLGRLKQSIYNEKTNLDVKSKKDLNRLVKIKTIKKLQKSKSFKLKERFEKKANQKKIKRDKYNTLRSIPKHLRKSKKIEPNLYRKGRLISRKNLRKSKIQQ